MNFELHSIHADSGARKGIVVDRIDYENPYNFQVVHRHSYFELFLFETGAGGKQMIDFQEYEIEGQCLYLVSPGQVHLMNRQPTENGMLIQFTREFLTGSIPGMQVDWRLRMQTHPQIRLSDAQFKSLRSHFGHLERIYRDDSPFVRAKLMHFLGYIFFEILECIPNHINFGAPHTVAGQFMQAAETHFKEMRVIAEYATLLNLSINRLTKEVKKHFGKSPLQIIQEMLTIEIKRLLIVEQLSHKEIAFHLSFDSQSSYTRFIKKQTGLTPTGLKSALAEIAK